MSSQQAQSPFASSIFPSNVQQDSNPFKQAFQSSIKPNSAQPQPNLHSILFQPSPENIKVNLRIRPKIENEYKQKTDSLKILNNSIILKLTSNDVFGKVKETHSVFTFDYIANENTSQQEIFEKSAKDICSSVFEGFNGTIFVYGQTSAGKTYTILGPNFSGINNSFSYLRQDNNNINVRDRKTLEIIEKGRINYNRLNEEEGKGIIPRCIEYLFELTQKRKEALKFFNKDNDLKVDFKISFCEIYNEQIYDLFDDKKDKASLKIRENNGIIDVEGLKILKITDIESAFMHIRFGSLNRQVSSTKMNNKSSRSHAVFTIYLTTKEKMGDQETVKKSVFNLVDLAGTERQKNTKTFGKNTKTAGNINKSLSTLTKVIKELGYVNKAKVSSFQNNRNLNTPKKNDDNNVKSIPNFNLSAVKTNNIPNLTNNYNLLSANRHRQAKSNSSSKNTIGSKKSSSYNRKIQSSSRHKTPRKNILSNSISRSPSNSPTYKTTIKSYNKTSLYPNLQSLSNFKTNLTSMHISYRDSKLTFLLKDSLSGNSKTCFIANISPTNSNLPETISTMNFISEVKKIKVSASQQMDLKTLENSKEPQVSYTIEDLNNAQKTYNETKSIVYYLLSLFQHYDISSREIIEIQSKLDNLENTEYFKKRRAETLEELNAELNRNNEELEKVTNENEKMAIELQNLQLKIKLNYSEIDSLNELYKTNYNSYMQKEEQLQKIKNENEEKAKIIKDLELEKQKIIQAKEEENKKIKNDITDIEQMLGIKDKIISGFNTQIKIEQDAQNAFDTQKEEILGSIDIEKKRQIELKNTEKNLDVQINDISKQKFQILEEIQKIEHFIKNFGAQCEDNEANYFNNVSDIKRKVTYLGDKKYEKKQCLSMLNTCVYTLRNKIEVLTFIRNFFQGKINYYKNVILCSLTKVKNDLVNENERIKNENNALKRKFEKLEEKFNSLTTINNTNYAHQSQTIMIQNRNDSLTQDIYKVLNKLNSIHIPSNDVNLNNISRKDFTKDNKKIITEQMKIITNPFLENHEILNRIKNTLSSPFTSQRKIDLLKLMDSFQKVKNENAAIFDSLIDILIKFINFNNTTYGFINENEKENIKKIYGTKRNAFICFLQDAMAVTKSLQEDNKHKKSEIHSYNIKINTALRSTRKNNLSYFCEDEEPENEGDKTIIYDCIKVNKDGSLSFSPIKRPISDDSISEVKPVIRYEN